MEIDSATLELILTGAGVTVAATIIASLVEVIKRAPVVGGLINSGRDAASLAFVASGALVAYAYIATTPTPDPANAFAAFLAFLGVAGLATKAYDAGSAIKASITNSDS